MPKPYECTKCGKPFGVKNAVQTHLNRCSSIQNKTPSTKDIANHDPQETRQSCSCNYCGQQFPITDRLQRHVWSHSHEQRRQCCGKSFRTTKDLEAHQEENDCPAIDLNRPPSRLFDNTKKEALFVCGIGQCSQNFPDVTKLR